MFHTPLRLASILLIALITRPAPLAADAVNQLTIHELPHAAWRDDGLQDARVTLSRSWLAELPAGQSEVVVDRLPRTIDPGTLHLSGAGTGLVVREQRFHAPIEQSDNLLGWYIGQQVLINRHPVAAERAGRPETISGTLVALDERMLVVESTNRQLPYHLIPRDSQLIEIKLIPPPHGHRPGPAATFTIQNRTQGMQKLQITGLVEQIAWRIDYRLVLTGRGEGELSAMLALSNGSGAAIESAEIQLVDATGGHTLSLAGTVTLPGDVQVRIPLLTPRPVRVSDDDGLQIDNTDANRLGQWLPRGRVAIHRRVDGADRLLSIGPAPAALPDEPWRVTTSPRQRQ